MLMQLTFKKQSLVEIQLGSGVQSVQGQQMCDTKKYNGTTA